MNHRKITREQAFRAMKTGEFGDEVAASHARVAVVMTQDWCPRWAAMKEWLYSLDYDFDLYELEYNRTGYFDEFRNFKETAWLNGLIPYIRYYNNGRLVRESNDVTRDEFLKSLG